MWVRSLAQEYLLEQEMTTHSSSLAWKILWTEESGRLQSMRLQRIGPDGAHMHACAHMYTHTHTHTHTHYIFTWSCNCRFVCVFPNLFL